MMSHRLICSLAASATLGLAADLPNLPTPTNQQEAVAPIATAYLGVSTKEVPDILLKHIDLPNGQGALVKMVTPASPAFIAGIQVGDVIYSIDGEGVKCRSCVQKVISQRKPGDLVKIGVIQGGASNILTVKLAEAPVFQSLDIEQKDENFSSLPQRTPPATPSSPQQIQGGLDDLFSLVDPGHQQQFRDLQSRLDRMDRADTSLFAQLQQQHQSLRNQMRSHSASTPNTGNQGNSFFSFSSSSSKTVMSGEYVLSLKSTNDDKSLLVKKRSGELVFEGPYNSEEDKKAVPKFIRDRLKSLNF